MTEKIKWQGKSHGGRFGHSAFIFLMRHAGLRACYCLLFFVSFYFAFFKRGVYSASAAYLRLAIAPKRFTTPAHVWRHVYSFGKTLVDKWAYVYGIGNIEVADGTSEDVRALIADGSGMIALNAHVGAWDMSSDILKKTYERETFVLGLNTEDEKISVILEKNRKADKIDTIETDTLSVLSAYNLLKGGAIIAMQGDRDMGGRSETVFLFGRRVKMPTSAFSLARHAEVPIVQFHCIRVASRKYRIVVFPPLNRLGLSEAAQLQTYANNLEGLLKSHPYQWANFYDFFGA